MTFYVYALIDSRNNEIFYIGKGTRNRAKSHLRERSLQRFEKVQPEKVERIREIKKSNGSVIIERLYTGIEDEEKALQLEKEEIKRVGLNNLTNKLPGGEKQRSGKNNPWYGRSLSKEHKKKIGKKQSLLDESEVKEIRWLLENTELLQTNIAERYNVHKRNIYQIKEEKRYRWVTGQKEPADIDIQEREKMASAGEKNGFSKLNREEVRGIKWLLKHTNLTRKEIGKKYGIKGNTVTAIHLESNWKHVEKCKKPNSYER